MAAGDIQNGNFDIHVATDRPGTLAGSSPPVTVGTTTQPRPSANSSPSTCARSCIAIYLRPQLWSVGIGRRLHATGIAGLATRFEQATLWVLDGNARTRAFYERQGWQPDGTVKRDTIGDAEVVEVRYRRRLNDHAQKS